MEQGKDEKLLFERPRGTGQDVASYPPEVFSARLRLKSYQNPLGKDRLPITIFQGAMLNFRGVPVAKVYFVILGGGSHPEGITCGKRQQTWNPGGFFDGILISWFIIIPIRLG